MKTIVIDCAELIDKEKAQSYLKNIMSKNIEISGNCIYYVNIKSSSFDKILLF